MGYDEQIEVLRERISEVDSKLVSLFEQRMKTVDDVAKLKQEYGKDVLDSKREDDVIMRAISQLTDKNLSQATREFFFAIMDISKKNQRQARFHGAGFSVPPRPEASQKMQGGPAGPAEGLPRHPLRVDMGTWRTIP